MGILSLVMCVIALVACSRNASNPADRAVRLLFAGDLMVGRGVTSMVENDPQGLFADVRPVIAEADLAFANLESPLTDAPLAASSPYDLRGAAESAAAIATAGFDVLALANNHTGDAGPEGVLDSISAAGAAGIETVGAGIHEEAYSPLLMEINGLRIAVLAFDCSGLGLSVDQEPGVARWGEDAVAAITEAVAAADVVIVGLHGGAAYVDRDPVLEQVGQQVVELGADIVWGHGAHAPLPVDMSGRSLIATGLGNLLFDQSYPDTQRGTLLEVMASRNGVVAWRTGTADHSSGRVRFLGWDLPANDTVLFEGEWWNLPAGSVISPGKAAEIRELAQGEVVAAGGGDVDGDGAPEMIVSFRRPFRETLLNGATAERWQDAEGRSAHIGVFNADDLAPEWIASTLRRPVAQLAVCDGSLAVAYDSLDDDAVVAAGGWIWNGFGFIGDVDLEGFGQPGCIDIDGDGDTEPAITERAVGP